MKFLGVIFATVGTYGLNLHDQIVNYVLDSCDLNHNNHL